MDDLKGKNLHQVLLCFIVRGVLGPCQILVMDPFSRKWLVALSPIVVVQTDS